MGRMYKTRLLYTNAHNRNLKEKHLCDCSSCELSFSMENRFCLKERLASCGCSVMDFVSHLQGNVVSLSL